MAKIVQGERNAKEKPKDFHFAFPSRRLSYGKIVQGERNAKEKLKDCLSGWLLLSNGDIVEENLAMGCMLFQC